MTAIACLLLGGWYLFATYGQYVVARKGASRNSPILIKGRLVSLWGPPQISYSVVVEDSFGVIATFSGAACSANRKWLWYEIDTAIKGPWAFRPGYLTIGLATGQRTNVPSIRGQLLVEQ
jgi:hypothetical protein